MVLDPIKIKQFARYVSAALPKNVRAIGEEVDKKICEVVKMQLARLDLVDRHAFEAQHQLLLRTREKLAQLEQQVAYLEGQIAQQRERE